MSNRALPRLLLILLAAAPLLLGGTASAAVGPAPAAPPNPVLVAGTFTAYSAGATAVTYDKAVPEGARASVLVATDLPQWAERESGRPGAEGAEEHEAMRELARHKGSGTGFVLHVGGLEPDRDYGAHLHTKPCGPTGDDAGPHYQHEVDPVQPSTDPEYANAENEAWLDFHTSPFGDAITGTAVEWTPRPGQAGSVVIHEEHTHTQPGHAGMAGARLACINVPL
ncbi:superoxide dismutase family protein [Murinocardiopsis flavida]|uniref:superoxide dismutase family protein n=1 Tax=Murinocardiopsis flavida TaxID=645275 RepID=UPI001B8025E3|nr:superoxide dismutase family protein [Murinocardiopsis flavida]